MIPVARVRWGFGGGFGDGNNGASGGSGGGGGVQASPMGFIEIHDGMAEYKSVRDPMRLAIAWLLLPVSAAAAALVMVDGRLADGALGAERLPPRGAARCCPRPAAAAPRGPAAPASRPAAAELIGAEQTDGRATGRGRSLSAPSRRMSRCASPPPHGGAARACPQVRLYAVSPNSVSSRPFCSAASGTRMEPNALMALRIRNVTTNE